MFHLLIAAFYPKSWWEPLWITDEKSQADIKLWPFKATRIGSFRIHFEMFIPCCFKIGCCFFSPSFAGCFFFLFSYHFLILFISSCYDLFTAFFFFLARWSLGRGTSPWSSWRPREKRRSSSVEMVGLELPYKQPRYGDMEQITAFFEKHPSKWLGHFQSFSMQLFFSIGTFFLLNHSIFLPSDGTSASLSHWPIHPFKSLRRAGGTQQPRSPNFFQNGLETTKVEVVSI